MKNLLRMSLFIIARAGLCLAVVAWIAGQWWGTIAEGSLSQLSCGLGMESNGFILQVATRPVTACIRPLGKGELASVNMYFESTAAEIGATQLLPGAKVLSGSGEYCLFVHHYFTITLFALFYGVLKWVYRKRGKAVADE